MGTPKYHGSKMRTESLLVHYQGSIQELVIISTHPSWNRLYYTSNCFQEHKGPTNSQVTLLNLYFSRNILTQHAKDACPLVSNFIENISRHFDYILSTPPLTLSPRTTLNYPQTLGINILYKEHDSSDALAGDRTLSKTMSSYT